MSGAIDAIIDSAQKRCSGHRLRLASGVETLDGHARMRRTAGGTDDAPLHLGGTEFAVPNGGGRFRSVAGSVGAARAC